MSAPSQTVSTWAPLRIGVFRALWLAVLVSNVAVWMQTVGAQWLLVSQPHASILVALVQTVDYLPDVVFGLVGGVLADTFDRRRLLMAVQAFLVIVGVALAALTFAGQMPPALLLTFTFLIGSASVVTLPAYQSLVPDLVPRNHLHSASALSSISINIARAAGPALAGVVIARTGVGAVFALNAAMYLLFLVGAPPVPPAGAHSPEFPRAIYLGASRRRPLRALRAGGSPHPAPLSTLSGAGQRALGAASAHRQPAARAGRRRLWIAARRTGCRRHLRRGHPPSTPRQDIDQRSTGCERDHLCTRFGRGG